MSKTWLVLGLTKVVKKSVLQNKSPRLYIGEQVHQALCCQAGSFYACS
jgi:hypothetical protein